MAVAVVSIAGVLASSSSSAAAQGTSDSVLCNGQVATIIGTAGDDVLRGTPGDDVIAALQGNDVVHAAGGNDVVCGGRGHDVVFGGQGFDVIFGGPGHDKIFGTTSSGPRSARNDVAGSRIYGGPGNDILEGTNRWDRIQGGPGRDVIRGFNGNDTLLGGPGHDTLEGGGATDRVRGGPGNDVLLVRPERSDTITADTLNGGAGRDVCAWVDPLDPRNFEGQVPKRISCGDNTRDGLPSEFEQSMVKLVLDQSGDLTLIGSSNDSNLHGYRLALEAFASDEGRTAIRYQFTRPCSTSYAGWLVDNGTDGLFVAKDFLVNPILNPACANSSPGAAALGHLLDGPVSIRVVDGAIELGTNDPVMVFRVSA